MKNKKALLMQFHALVSVEEKLDFWTYNLPVSHIEYLEKSLWITNEDLKDFRIEISNPEERRIYNLWIIENFAQYSTNPEKERFLINIDALKESLESDLDKTDSKKEFIQKRLHELDSTFKLTATGRKGKYMAMTNKIFIVDYETYKNYLEYEILPDYSVISRDIHSIIQIANSVSLAKYRLFLREKLESISQESLKQIKEVSLDQRLLMLHYLGALDMVMESNNNSKQAKFLSLIIKTDRETIRQRFSSINDLFTPKEKSKRKTLVNNLQEIQSLFTELGLEKIVKKIKADIKKLNTVVLSRRL